MQVVLDIETSSIITETQLQYELDKFHHNNSRSELSDSEIKEKIIAESSLKPQMSQIVSICWITSKGEQFAYGVDNNNYERDILKEFSLWLEENIHKIRKWITFNGKNFDMPFIRTRCAINAISLSPKFYSQNIYYPFNNEYHCDLFHILKSSLNQNLLAFGLSEKIEHGWEVSDMFKNKEYERITKYCLDDVRSTAKLFQKVKKYI